MNASDRREGREPPASTEQVEAYLQSQNWHLDGKLRNVATIWHRQIELDAEVLVPLSFAKDFRQRLRDALASIATFEDRPARDVLADIKRMFSNVITVRVIHADTDGGTIPINDGVLLIAKAKDLLTAAAQSVFAKRKHYTSGAPKEAKDYLDTLLLGQTEVGSYVVNVIAPVQQNAAVALETAEAVPLSQAITTRLVLGLEALEKAGTAYEVDGSLTAFDEAVQSGASANMCDALLGFSGANRNRTFEVTVTSIAGPMFESEPKKFEFEDKHIEVLKKASEYYKENYVLKDRRLIGHITKLQRKKEESSGTITIDSELGDVGDRKVKVDLTGDDYHLAVLAHDKKRMVRVEGDVHVKSKSAELLSPKNFGVIELEDLL
jgi:hypothetical protein